MTGEVKTHVDSCALCKSYLASAALAIGAAVGSHAGFGQADTTVVIK